MRGAMIYRNLCNKDFPGGSDGKASAYDAGNLGSIPGWGRSQNVLSEIIPLICPSAIWGQDPVFSHPEFPQATPFGWLQFADR